MRIDNLSYEEAKGKFFRRKVRVAYIHTNSRPLWVGGGYVGQPLREADWYECDSKGNRIPQEFKYPIYKKSRGNKQIVKFTSLKVGEVIVKGNVISCHDVGYVNTAWMKHTSASIWGHIDFADIPPNVPTEVDTLEYLDYWDKQHETLGTGKVNVYHLDGRWKDTCYGLKPSRWKSGPFYFSLDKMDRYPVPPKIVKEEKEGMPKLGTQEYLDYWKKVNETTTIYIHVSYGVGGRTFFTSSKHGEDTPIDEWAVPRSLKDKVFSLNTLLTPEEDAFLKAYEDRGLGVLSEGTSCVKDVAKLTEEVEILTSNLCPEHQLDENKTEKKEETMKELSKEMILEALCESKEKVKKVLTALQARQKVIGVLYGRDGALESQKEYKSEKAAKKIMQLPTNIGKTIVIYKEAGTVTTDIPLVETKTK